MGRRTGAALLAVAPLLAACYNGADEVAQLARQHAVASGRVVLLECHNGGRWWYEFEAGGTRRRGPAQEAAGCARRKLGDPVTVYYNPAAPAVHRARVPAQAYAAERGWYVPDWLWFCLAALALPLSALMALRRGARR
jgi:hypothetical protein